MDNKIYVLDSTVFLERYSDSFSDLACATVYEVAEEIQEPYAKIRFDMFVKSGLSLMTPAEKFVKAVDLKVSETRDKLSRTDVMVIALALDFASRGKDAAVVSDDYGIQNVALSLGVEFLPVSSKGIGRALKWERVCTACGKPGDGEECDVCGSRMKFVSRA
ncbi:MAG: NOB1 family endonuclease [archaeon]|nr:NOB1 family endonuclease [archaeon]